MQPIRPNTPSNKCPGSVGSNCIDYNDDRTISCIPTCEGDTVSDMIYKLGQQQCYTTNLLDWSSLNLDCCYSACPSCNKQPSDPLNIMKIVLACICNQAAQIAQLQTDVNVLKAGVTT